MSIEYTIDIQLTELGFSDILQPLETSVRETPCRSTPPDDSLSPSHPPASLSAAHKQRLRVRGQQSAGGKGAGAKQTSDREQTTVVSAPPPPPPQTLSREPLNAEVLRDEQAVEGAARSEATVNDPTARPESTDLPQLIAEQGDNGQTDADDGDAAGEDWVAMQQDVEEDSDDSEVSEVYEEEEVDEDNEDEEGQNNESNHSAGYCCSVCDLQLPSKFKLQDHMNLHTGARPYCCAECGKRFCQIYNYRVHLRTHAEIQVDRLMCRVCLTGFASQEDLKDHLSKTHFEDKFYECDLCKRVFTSLKACQYHVQLHKRLLNGICKLCGRKFSSTKLLARHQKKICQCNFKCTDCTKTFTKKNALLKHSFSHLGLLPYTCIRCRCHFRLAKLYRQHKCEPERINCVACLREFLSQEDFQQHKKDTGCWGGQETKGNEIRCLECGQRFDTSEELKKHAGAHQRVLKCAECGKGFRSALLLMSHMGGHAGKSPCLCQSCGLGFPHQQNYDSHLKTCGQTPQPASTQKHGPKKRQSSKTSSSETEKLNAKPGLVTGGVSVGSSPPDGLWKLTLHEQPPPGAKLVLFLPVCPTRTNGLALQSAVSQTLSGPDMQVQPQAALSPVHFGVNTALGLAPKDLVTGIKQDPDCKAPLDLSMKCNPALSAPSDIPLLPTKNEPDKFENSANGTKRQEFKNSNSKAIVKLNSGETDRCAVLKQFKMDPMDLSLINVNTTSSGLIIDIKKEPQSPGPDVDLWSSRSCQLTEKEIKMEVDGSCPAYTDVEK